MFFLLYLLYSIVFYLHCIIFLFLLKLSTEVQYMSQKHFTAHPVWVCDRDERVQHYPYLLTIWIICICICTRSGWGLIQKWVGLSWNVCGFNRFVILSMQLIWVDQKLLYLLLIRKLFTGQHQHWASDQWFWAWSQTNYSITILAN